MSVTVYFANVSKRRNSTYQGTFSTSYDCVLKDATSLDRPTFLVSAATMDYNAAKWGDRYYFIDDVVSVRNNQWEVSCILDVLATYKADILASTQYVTYSASAAKTWLPDTRIPILKSTTVSRNGDNAPFFTQNGFWVLTVNGKNGCVPYVIDYRTQLDALIASIDNWRSNSITNILNGSTGGVTYTWDPTDLDVNFESLGKMMIQTGLVGNAYANAPQNLRSCIWVPLDASYFRDTATPGSIYLGEFDTGVGAYPCKVGAQVSIVSVTIPWQHNDWRRGVCEDIYLYLPFAGLIKIPTDSITHSASLSVRVSVSATDGTVCYRVSDDSYTTIGTYGGSCAANYAIGINQQASAGQILQTGLEGVEKSLSAAVNSSVSPLSAAAVGATSIYQAARSSYDVLNTTYSSAPSTIGSFGGGAGYGLGIDKIYTYSISHDTAITPASMAATMGRPMMEPKTLSTLSGYCQCANAHVAVAAQAQELDAIDVYLNSGFYIE